MNLSNETDAGAFVTSAANLTQLLERWEQESRPRRIPAMSVGGLMFAGGGGLMLAALWLLQPDLLRLLCALFGGFIILMSLLVMNIGVGTFPLTKVQQQIIAGIEALDDVSASLSLADLVHSRQFRAAGPLREAILSTLTRLLSKMSEEEVVTQFRHRSDAFISLLTHAMAISHPELVTTILRLLPALADSRTLVPTARFIVDDAPTRHEQQVREAAREVLPKLLERVDVGGPKSLSNWIQQLPMIPQNQQTTGNLKSMTIEQIILPHVAIMKLLPHMAPADFLALNHSVRQRLYANLRYMFLPRLSEQYDLIVIEMISLSADVEALSVVRDLYDAGRYMTPYVSPYPAVREAARACAAALEEQLEKEKVSKMLLRGASAPDAAPDTLLRAASGNTTTNPQFLLRANVQQSVGDQKTHEPVSSAHRTEYGVPTTQTGETEQDATVRLSGGQQ